jgi:ribosomal protein S18 acetylase RimI-like enzyme
MQPDLARAADISSWLEIVREVEPLFGPMPDFEATLLRKIEQRAALRVLSDDRDEAGPVLGGMLLGGTREHGWIRWLAVRSAARGKGIGQCLVEAAIKRMPAAKTISLDTFREENVAGWPARRLYRRLGFVPGALVEPQGMPRQRFDLVRG